MCAGCYSQGNIVRLRLGLPNEILYYRLGHLTSINADLTCDVRLLCIQYIKNR